QTRKSTSANRLSCPCLTAAHTAPALSSLLKKSFALQSPNPLLPNALQKPGPNRKGKNKNLPSAASKRRKSRAKWQSGLGAKQKKTRPSECGIPIMQLENLLTELPAWNHNNDH